MVAPASRDILDRITNIDLVLYHDNCYDGWCSAWIAGKVLDKNKVQFVAVDHGDEKIDRLDIKDKDILMLDFSYKRPVLERILAKCKTLTVIDHHKSALTEIDGLQHNHKWDCIFNLDKSGAMLTWEYFYPNDTAPQIVGYVQDRDLWTWKKDYSKAINAVITSYPMDTLVWDSLEVQIENAIKREALRQQGEAILRYQEQCIEAECKKAVEIEMDGYKVLCVNTSVKSLISDIGERLAQGRPFSATYFIKTITIPDPNNPSKMKNINQKVWSLRSREGGIDVSEIAKKHGGGGHKQAAGFQEEI